VTSRKKCHHNIAKSETLTIVKGLKVYIDPETQLQQGLRGSGCQIVLASATSMIGMRVCNDRSLHRLPRIDVKIPCWTIKAGWSDLQ
jgi:hypothetical protein